MNFSLLIFQDFGTFPSQEMFEFCNSASFAIPKVTAELIKDKRFNDNFLLVNLFLSIKSSILFNR